MLSPARSSDDDKRSDFLEPSIDTSDEQGGNGMGGDKLGVTGKISPARSMVQAALIPPLRPKFL
jgi:hypothetical protein